MHSEQYQSYPNPVLGNGDDFPNNQFNISIRKRETSSGNLQIRVDWEPLGHDGLNQIIKGKDAEIQLLVENPSTFYNKIYKISFEPENIITLKQDDLRGKVIISARIISLNILNNYFFEDLNDDFEGSVFNIPQNYTLAISNKVFFNFDPKFSNEFPKAKKSIFKVEKHYRPYLEQFLEGDYITARLPINTYEIWKNINRKQYSGLLFSIIVVPILTEALKHIMLEPYSETLWASKLQEIVEKNSDVSIEDDHLTISQTLLKFPIENSLESILNLHDQIYQSDE